MEYKFGNCTGCNKLMKYEKFPICKTCEDKYIKQIMDYGYSHGLNTTMEELHKELDIPVKVLEFFEKEGLLANKGQEQITNEEEEKRNRDLATLRQIYGQLQESNNQKNDNQEKNGIGTGMYTRDIRRR